MLSTIHLDTLPLLILSYITHSFIEYIIVNIYFLYYNIGFNNLYI
jgi:hypothetical protein